MQAPSASQHLPEQDHLLITPIISQAYDYGGKSSGVPKGANNKVFRPTFPMGRFITLLRK